MPWWLGSILRLIKAGAIQWAIPPATWAKDIILHCSLQWVSEKLHYWDTATMTDSSGGFVVLLSLHLWPYKAKCGQPHLPLSLSLSPASSYSRVGLWACQAWSRKQLIGLWSMPPPAVKTFLQGCTFSNFKGSHQYWALAKSRSKYQWPGMQNMCREAIIRHLIGPKLEIAQGSLRWQYNTYDMVWYGLAPG